MHSCEAAAALQLRLLEFTAGTDGEIEMVFASLVEQKAEALLVPTSPYFLNRAEKVVGFAAHYRIPAIYGRRNFTTAGGLLSYGDDFTETYRQVGIYAGRILKGEKPANLPVVQTTKLVRDQPQDRQRAWHRSADQCAVRRRGRSRRARNSRRYRWSDFLVLARRREWASLLNRFAKG
jgi:hypothetical protein